MNLTRNDRQRLIAATLFVVMFDFIIASDIHSSLRNHLIDMYIVGVAVWWVRALLIRFWNTHASEVKRPTWMIAGLFLIVLAAVDALACAATITSSFQAAIAAVEICIAGLVTKMLLIVTGIAMRDSAHVQQPEI